MDVVEIKITNRQSQLCEINCPYKDISIIFLHSIIMVWLNILTISLDKKISISNSDRTVQSTIWNIFSKLRFFCINIFGRVTVTNKLGKLS